MGVIDDNYVSKANDPAAIVGRKVGVSRDEVTLTIRITETLARRLFEGLLQSKPWSKP